MAEHHLDPSEAVHELEERRRVAVDCGDAEALSQMLDDGYRQVHADGSIDDKASALARVASYRGTSEPRRAELQIYGDVAVMTGASVRRAVIDGIPREGRIFVTQIVVKRDGVWRFVHAHATLMPPI